MSEKEFDKDKEEVYGAHFWRVQDFWGKHNLSSRSLVLTMVITMLSFVVGFFIGYPVPSEIITTAFWAFTSVVIVYAIGPTALEKSADLISKIKGFR